MNNDEGNIEGDKDKKDQNKDNKDNDNEQLLNFYKEKNRLLIQLADDCLKQMASMQADHASTAGAIK